MNSGGYYHTLLFFTRLLPNRSPVAWGSQRIALGALIFHSNTFHFICWAPKFSAFSSEGPFKIFLGSSLGLINFNRINGLVSSIMCVTLMSGLLENVIMGSYQMTMFKGF